MKSTNHYPPVEPQRDQFKLCFWEVNTRGLRFSPLSTTSSPNPTRVFDFPYFTVWRQTILLLWVDQHSRITKSLSHSLSERLAFHTRLINMSQYVPRRASDWMMMPWLPWASSFTLTLSARAVTSYPCRPSATWSRRLILLNLKSTNKAWRSALTFIYLYTYTHICIYAYIYVSQTYVLWGARQTQDILRALMEEQRERSFCVPVQERTWQGLFKAGTRCLGWEKAAVSGDPTLRPRLWLSVLSNCVWGILLPLWQHCLT